MQAISILQQRPLYPTTASLEPFTYTQYLNPARTEVTDNLGWAATFTSGARTVAIRGHGRTFTEQTQGISDSFSRVAGGAWGYSEAGGKWYPSGGSSGDYAVNGSVATMVLNTANISRRCTISNVLQDIDATVKFKTDKTALGSEQVGGILFAHQDTSNHYLARLAFTPSGATDTFSRTTTAGWGVTNTNQTWSTSGVATDYSTNGSEGQHSVGSINVSRRTILPSVTGADFDITTRVKTDVLASGASIAGAVVGRYIDGNNHYIFRLRFGSTAAHQVFVAIQKQQSGVITTLGGEATTSYAHTAGTYYWMRAQAMGTTLQMKVWPETATEPSVWDVTLTDSTFGGSGAVGVRSIITTGNTNALPVVFSYDDFAATLDGASTDNVELSLQKRVDDVYTYVAAAVVLPGVTHAAGDYFHIRVQHTSGSVMRVRAWKEGSPEPTTWAIETQDTTYVAGRVGVRALCSPGTTNLPVVFSWDDMHASGAWPAPPVVAHSIWVRVLPAPFSGVVDETWLRAALNDQRPDALAVALQYLRGSPAVIDSLQGNLQVAGLSSYGPLEGDGTRQEGADFNDYLGISWQYGSFTDQPEAGQFRCMDCSGFVRMIYGYRGAFTLTSSVLNGISIPRVSHDIADSGPGTIVIANTGVPPSTAELGKLLPGDIVSFDADTSNPEEEEGQLDHLGIYLGVDTAGKHRFISSRKVANGPTMSDLGGPSVLEGTNLYARSLRLTRRF